MAEPNPKYVESLRHLWRRGNVDERQQLVSGIARYVSKLGELSVSDEELRALATFFNVEECLDLYQQIRDTSGRLECEWRQQFVDYFPQSRNALPKEIA